MYGFLKVLYSCYSFKAVVILLSFVSGGAMGNTLAPTGVTADLIKYTPILTTLIEEGIGTLKSKECFKTQDIDALRPQILTYLQQQDQYANILNSLGIESITDQVILLINNTLDGPIEE